MDAAIVGVEILQHCQYFKVHRVLLEKYLGERNIELLKQEVKLSIGI